MVQYIPHPLMASLLLLLYSLFWMMSLSYFYILETTHNNPNMHIDYKPYLQCCPSLFYMEVLGQKDAWRCWSKLPWHCCSSFSHAWNCLTVLLIFFLPECTILSPIFIMLDSPCFLLFESLNSSPSTFKFDKSARNMNVHLLDSQQGLQYRCLYDSMCPQSWEIQVFERTRLAITN